MNYLQAVNWLRYQEQWTEKEIPDLLNSDGSDAVIAAAIDAAISDCSPVPESDNIFDGVGP